MNSNTRTILFGVLIGAATGLIAAVMLNRRAENGDRTTAITASEGIRLGVMVAGLLRAISSLGEEE